VRGTRSARLLSFPNPGNEVSARLVAGPPKRFAQGIGAVLSMTAAVLALGFDLHTAAYVALGAVGVAATLESVFALCIGCKLFAVLMRAGVIPQEVCERCSDTRVNPAPVTDRV
jgi:hypothetical protein